MSSLALPRREISHFLPNCTTRTWTLQTHYFFIITLETLHLCALHSPQLILLSLCTCAPCDPRTDLLALCQAIVSGGGVFGEGKSEKGMMGGRRSSGGPCYGNELTQAGRREAFIRSLCLRLMTPWLRAFCLLHGSRTNTDSAHTYGSHLGNLHKGLMTFECMTGFVGQLQ